MDIESIKSNLKAYYDREAELRDASEKEEWKKAQRARFYGYIKAEGKASLLEIGAGTGSDSVYFKERGLNVVAVDLSSEMVRICKAKLIEAYELDFYDLSSLNRTFDCVWSMNSLLHVPKPDLPRVLNEINNALNEGGLFYMGVYGGADAESDFVNDVSSVPRYFSYLSEHKLKDALSGVFDILEYQQIDVGRNTDFQAAIMRKRE
jgi:cyclopropane fatty-acyl-phospholipid synthase-like methyltransferase